MGLVQKNELVLLLEDLTKRKEAVRERIAAGESAEVLAAIEDARREVAGAMRSAVERVDGGTVVMLLGRERAQVYGELARLEARAREAMGEEATAQREERRADEIARALGG
jgi:hypothetical protein